MRLDADRCTAVEAIGRRTVPARHQVTVDVHRDLNAPVSHLISHVGEQFALLDQETADVWRSTCTMLRRRRGCLPTVLQQQARFDACAPPPGSSESGSLDSKPRIRAPTPAAADIEENES